MKKLTGFLLLIILFASACEKKSDSSSSDEFSNSLKLGTGMNASNFTLTGEGTVFQAGTIYFRLECKDDMAGSAVRIAVTQLGTSVVTNHDYPSLQSYGHLYMSSFNMATPGNYSATGILTTSSKTIATINFTVQ
jgi:hypothetical protein